MHRPVVAYYDRTNKALETGPESGRLTLTGFPAHRFRFVCYVEGLAGCLEATLALCRCPGTVTVVEQDSSGRAVYEIGWKER